MPKSISMTLPKSVIAQDHRLEKAAEDAGRKLCELRWHWTLDESNPKRVSLSQYARDVGRGRNTIHQYAHAFGVLRTNSAISVIEALYRAKMSAQRQQATETVARSHGVTFGTAAQRKELREEARRLQRARTSSLPPEEVAENKRIADALSKELGQARREAQAAGTERLHNWLTGWDYLIRNHDYEDWIDENTQVIERLPQKEIRKLLSECDQALDFLKRLKNAINNRGGKSNVVTLRNGTR